MQTPTVTFRVNTDNEEAMENVHIKWVEFKLNVRAFFGSPTGRKNGFTNVCERCKYVVNLELQICITFALSAKVWANTYIC